MAASKPTSDWTLADIGLFEEIFQLLCVSRMNQLYYERRLRRVQFISMIMEFTIAATASGSGIATLLAQSADTRINFIWTGVLLFAAIVSIVRPLYAPGKKIEIMTRQQHGYMANFFALKKLAHGIRQSGHVTEEIRRRFDTIYDRHVQISADDESTPDDSQIARARSETVKELPRGRFWWPFNDLMPDISGVNEVK
jgi:hypothetical protein